MRIDTVNCPLVESPFSSIAKRSPAIADKARQLLSALYAIVFVFITASLGTVAVTSVSHAGVNALLGVSGFVFLAAATDGDSRWRVTLQVISALVLMALALLGRQFGAEFTIVGTWVLAVWVVAAVFPSTRLAQ